MEHLTIPDEENVTFDSNKDKWTFNYDTLVARRGSVFTFLDDVFTYRNRENELRGATATRMVPVTEEEMERRMDELRDYEWSSLAHIYDEGNNQQSWDEWIEGQIRREGRRLVYDPSYEARYGPKVEELAKEELGYENVAAVECVGGGRAFNEVKKDFDKVYDMGALEAMEAAETDWARIEKAVNEKAGKA